MKKLYEEALADVKSVREAALKDAQQRVLEELTPRIKEFIDNQLVGNVDEDDEDDEDEMLLDLADAPQVDVVVVEPPPVTPVVQQPLCTAPPAPAQTTQTTIPPTEPVVVPVVPPAPPADMTIVEPVAVDVAQPLPTVEPVVEPATDEIVPPSVDDLEDEIYQVGESLKRLEKSTKALKESKLFKNQLSQLVTVVENMYEYVQESIGDEARKTRLEERLESYNKKLINLQEGTMSKKMLKEEDVTLKLTGLPDDLNLEDLGVDLIAGEEEVEGEEGELDLELTDEEGDDTAEPAAEEAPAEDSGDVDLDLDLESEHLSDDTVVEIDENMLRRELARIRESEAKAEKLPKNAQHGKKMSPKTLDDFGGGEEEELLESTTSSETSSLKEKEACDEAGMCDEAETCGEETVKEMENDDVVLTRESRIQRAAVVLGAKIKKSIAEAKAKGDVKRVARLTEAYNAQAERYNSSVVRAKQAQRLVEGATKTSSNSESKTDGLRRKLSEANLDNVKLQYANKVLQSQVSNEKKLRIIEQLDAARTPREAKLVYESSAKLLESAQSEEKQHTLISGGSRATKSGGVNVVNEGVEVDRWARLAGLK